MWQFYKLILKLHSRKYIITIEDVTTLSIHLSFFLWSESGILAFIARAEGVKSLIGLAPACFRALQNQIVKNPRKIIINLLQKTLWFFVGDKIIYNLHKFFPYAIKISKRKAFIRTDDLKPSQTCYALGPGAESRAPDC